MENSFGYYTEGSARLNGSSLVSMLHEVQAQYNYLPEDVLREVCAQTGISPIEIYRVATFYKAFSLSPRGRHKVVTCSGTACHVRGSEKVTEELARMLGVQPGETTADGEYSLDTVNCLGACALAPLVAVDGEYHANLTPNQVVRLLQKHLTVQREKGCGCAHELEQRVKGVC